MSDAMIVRRGGGVKLNFRINQYAPDTDLSNFIGKTNEIAVLTATPIPDWSIGMTEPPVPTVGSVWIKTGTASLNNIEALKKNSIRLNLQGVYQYVTGEWQRKKAFLWQSGQWNDLDIFLYDNGDQCTDSTGGWVVRYNSNGYANIGQAYITLRGGSSSNENCAFTAEKINLSGYTKLMARMNVTSYSGDSDAQRIWLGLFSTNTSYLTNCVIGKVIARQVGEQTLELDITNYKDSEDYYVGLRNQTSSATVYEVWLE